MICVPLLRRSPLRKFLRTFQSKAVFTAFSMPSAPPSMKNMCLLRDGGTARRANVSTNSAMYVV